MAYCVAPHGKVKMISGRLGICKGNVGRRPADFIHYLWISIMG